MDALATAATIAANNTNNNNNSNTTPITTAHDKTAEEILKEKRRKNKLCQQRHRERKTALATATSAASSSSPFTTPLTFTQHLPFASFLSPPPFSSSSSSSFALAPHANTNTTTYTIAQELESKGHVITPFNPLLFAYIEGFKFNMTKPEDKRLKVDYDLYGGQHQYEFEKGMLGPFNASIKPFLTEELKILEKFFKQELFTLTDVKYTTNEVPERNGEHEECQEQGPHIDAVTNKVVFVTIPLSEQVVATRVYGSVEQMIELRDENEINEFFNIENKALAKGQCFMFLPSFVHAAPKLALIQRNLIHLEYSASSIAADHYQQTFIDVLNTNEVFITTIKKLGIQRKWLLPYTSKKREGKHDQSYDENDDDDDEDEDDEDDDDYSDYGLVHGGDDKSNSNHEDKGCEKIYYKYPVFEQPNKRRKLGDTTNKPHKELRRGMNTSKNKHGDKRNRIIYNE